MRVWHNGCAPAFQAGYTGSTPVTRSRLVGFPSGQRGQTVNLLAPLSMVRIHLPPPFKNQGLTAKKLQVLFFCPVFAFELKFPYDSKNNRIKTGYKFWVCSQSASPQNTRKNRSPHRCKNRNNRIKNRNNRIKNRNNRIKNIKERPPSPLHFRPLCCFIPLFRLPVPD